MKVELVGQALRVFRGEEDLGPEWIGEFEIGAWQTLDLIRTANRRLGPDHSGKTNGFVFQYVRAAASAALTVKFSSTGRFAILVGHMSQSDHVIYHRIQLQP